MSYDAWKTREPEQDRLLACYRCGEKERQPGRSLCPDCEAEVSWWEQAEDAWQEAGNFHDGGCHCKACVGDWPEEDSNYYSREEE